MRAVVIENGSLHLKDVPTPEPGDAIGHVRVRVRAAAVNRADLMQLRGMYPAPFDAPADIPGMEIAGEVDAVGPLVKDLAVGDRVYGIIGGGGYAEHVVTHARTLAKIPDGLDFEKAAAIPEAFLTAYDAMVTQAHLAPGETVLIHAVGSGVGTAAVQIAKAIGATSFGTARTQDKLHRAKDLGLEHGVVVGADVKFAAKLPKPPEVVLELVGGNYVPESLAALEERGRLVLIGLMAGPSTDMPLGVILRKRLTIIGTTMRARPIEGKIALAQVLQRNITPLVAKGVFKPIVDRVLPLEKAAEAIEALASNATFGKIVLAV